MGIRFRKSIKLLPGVRLNLSKSGVSTSLGVKGLTVNVKSGRKTRVTAGIPGSGLSVSETIGTPKSIPNQSIPPARNGNPAGATIAWIGAAVVLYLILKVLSAFF